MFPNFHSLQPDMVFGIINSFSWAFDAVSGKKKLHDFNAFPVIITWIYDIRDFPPAYTDQKYMYVCMYVCMIV